MIATAAQTAEFTGLTGWVVDVVAASGPIGVALLLALDNVVPIVPSEVVLPFAGYLAANGELSFVLTLVAATIGSTASAYVYYELGRRLGPERAHDVLLRVPLTDENDLDRATSWFDRHGNTAVFTGRFVPLVRSLVSLPAGTQGMGRLRFGVLTALGSGIWNAIWLGIGMAIGRNWENAGTYSNWFNWAIALFVVAVVAHYVWRRRARLPWNRA
ncbi:DedA family protein [Salsipaludibacter albus]|uniref:DedA family protein n=1 Tax=Salsipaludibacter albus TaxID=2849650 RepID=UPI001EE458D6|nr:DedA family protein [Salsipaludibacter albus]MBY5163497.1 DedA family protein [Salsipaludibacter albus]